MGAVLNFTVYSPIVFVRYLTNSIKFNCIQSPYYIIHIRNARENCAAHEIFVLFPFVWQQDTSIFMIIGHNKAEVKFIFPSQP